MKVKWWDWKKIEMIDKKRLRRKDWEERLKGLKKQDWKDWEEKIEECLHQSYQSSSIYINLLQSTSIFFNLHQSSSIYINLKNIINWVSVNYKI